MVSWPRGFTVALTTAHHNSKCALLKTGRENRQHRADMAIGGLKVGTCPTGAFRNIFLFFLSPALSFSVFCNFNLPAKYSCCVLSMTVSESPGLTSGETRTCFSLYSSVSVSPCLRQSGCEYYCTGLNEAPSLRFHVMSLSCDKPDKKSSYAVCRHKRTAHVGHMGRMTSKGRNRRNVWQLSEQLFALF